MMQIYTTPLNTTIYLLANPMEVQACVNLENFNMDKVI